MEEVNHPSHYNRGNIEVIDFIEDKNFGFCLGNVIKYISRAGKKISANKTTKEKELQDFKKAKWYLERSLFEAKIDFPLNSIKPESYIKDQDLDEDIGEVIKNLSQTYGEFDLDLVIKYLKNAEIALDKKIKKLESEIFNQK